MISGFQATVVLWAWAGVVLLHAAFRAALDPEPDPVRDSGPIV